MAARSYLYLLAFLFSAGQAVAQRPGAENPKQPEGKKINIISADKLGVLSQDSVHKFTMLVGKAHVLQEKTHFYADSIVLNEVDNSLEAFGNIHINDADSVHTYSQYLKYLGKEKKAFLKKKVRLTDGKGELTTEELEYDVTLKIGTYLNKGKVVNKKTVLTSKEGYYYGDTKDVYFKQKVVLIDPEYKVLTDTLQYNINTDIATFVSPTVIYSDSSRRTIKTHKGFFDMKNKRGILNERSVIEDSAGVFTADDMAMDDSTKLGEFRGNVVYRSKDTAQGADLIANNVKTNRKKDIILATEKPLLILKQGRDSIFISGDTMFSARMTDLLRTRHVPVVRDSLVRIGDSIVGRYQPVQLDTSNTKDNNNNKYFEVYNHVKIYSDSLQAVGDSLFYSLQDSVFRLFGNPVVWSKENQIMGDTIYLYTKNKKPERLYVFENAIEIGRIDSTNYFNQLKSTTLNVWFADGKIYYMRAKGTAQNVYYGQDETGAFTGVYKSNADMINIFFADNKPTRISFLRGPNNDGYPMHQVNHDEIKVRGFKWLDNRRPKSKFDLLSY